MSKLKLYHCKGARSLRPLWMLEELGLSYELHVLPFPPRVLAKLDHPNVVYITDFGVGDTGLGDGSRVPKDSARIEALGAVDELFLTSSVRELVSVVRVDDVAIGRGRPGPVFRRLLDAYRRAALRGG